MNDFLKGKISKTIFENKDNGFHILLFKVLDASDKYLYYINSSVKISGYFNNINNYDTYILYGSFFMHNKYGETFRLDKLEIEEKKGNSIIDFLSSDLFPGIGDAKAKLIYDKLGDNAFDVILNNPNNLSLIDGLTKNNIKVLHDVLTEHENSYKTIIYLNDLGFNVIESNRIYKLYKQNTKKQIEEDIYKLRRDINIISFNKIDMIAQKLKIDSNSKIRLQDILVYVMELVSYEYGNTFFYYEELKYEILNRFDNINIDLLNDAIKLSIDNNLIVIDNDKYYLKKLSDAENNIKRRFTLLNNSNSKNKDNKKMYEKLKEIENKFNIDYNDKQEEAIISSISNYLTIITGGPGTGKTTILKAICKLYKEFNKDEITLLAPTGRAAKRMSDISNNASSTIHSFLKWNKDTDKYQINEYNKSKAKLIILDESSMIDTYLMNNLLKGISVNCKMVLIGDFHQLPSVGPGDILQDLILSNKFNVIKLDQLYRQEKDSNLINLAYDIQNNNINENIFNISNDLIFINKNDNEIINSICDIALKYKDENINDFQILVPMYMGINGIDNINRVLQSILNKQDYLKNEIQINGITYRENDKVIQLNNMPESNIYNGDIGIIKEIRNNPKKVIIDFDNNIVEYTSNTFNNFKLAYAISIHKSQGSEFKTVILPMSLNYNRMLYKRLIYTGVTRAKSKLYIIGDINALKKACLNNQADNRRTGLKYKF